jgi:hypothetical protein
MTLQEALQSKGFKQSDEEVTTSKIPQKSLKKKEDKVTTESNKILWK